MKKLFLLLIFLSSVLSLPAQSRVSDYIRRSNRSAKISLPKYRNRLSREYRLSSKVLDQCYNKCGRNWGNVGLALEASRASGRNIMDVCDYYRRYHSRGWDHILQHIGIRPGLGAYRLFYSRIGVPGNYWFECDDDDAEEAYYKHMKKRHKYEKKQYKKYKKWHDDDDDDDDDDD